jgi:hypothetical protein
MRSSSMSIAHAEVERMRSALAQLAGAAFARSAAPAAAMAAVQARAVLTVAPSWRSAWRRQSFTLNSSSIWRGTRPSILVISPAYSAAYSAAYWPMRAWSSSERGGCSSALALADAHPLLLLLLLLLLTLPAALLPPPPAAGAR